MQIWVGLGNPGEKYAGNRHNIGFMAIDAIAGNSLHMDGDWKSKFKGLIGKGSVYGNDVIFLKPMTFMNESGQSVQAAMKFYKIPLENVTVFHDELDLSFGKVRTKFGGGIAGHNGLRSIKQHCGNDFQRVRIGIDHPGDKAQVHRHVLSDFRKDEIDLRDSVIDAIQRNGEHLADGKSDLFQTRVMENIALHSKKG